MISQWRFIIILLNYPAIDKLLTRVLFLSTHTSKMRHEIHHTSLICTVYVTRQWSLQFLAPCTSQWCCDLEHVRMARDLPRTSSMWCPIFWRESAIFQPAGLELQTNVNSSDEDSDLDPRDIVGEICEENKWIMEKLKIAKINCHVKSLFKLTINDT